MTELDEIFISKKLSQKLIIGKFKKSKINNYFGCGIKPWITARFFKYTEEYERTPFFFYIRILTKSDVKNSKFFIKTEKEWENDNGTKVSNALDLVQAEKMKHVSEYMKGETFLKSENETDMIMDLVKILSKDSNSSKKNKIIKNIANSVVLDPSMNNI